MRRLGLVARADQGGIAAQCWSFARRMRPEKILVVHTEHTTRGHAKPEIYGGLSSLVKTCRRGPRPQDAEWLVAGVDVVFTVECFYGLEIPIRASNRGVETVIQGNPEMTGMGERFDKMLAPTSWRLDALPGSPELLPFPTDLELLPPREPSERVKRLYHVSSDAMLDRNGTDILLESLGHVRHELELYIRGGGMPRGQVRHHGLVTVHWLGHYDGLFYDAWPQHIDAFVLPRRYGGLCLPMQEAASLGLPIITTDLEPQRQWLPSASLVPARVEQTARMRGGTFDVHSCDPRSLAGAINAMVEEPGRREYMARRARDWAQAFSWDSIGELYNKHFR